MYSTIRIGAAYLEQETQNVAPHSRIKACFKTLTSECASVKECFKILKLKNEKLVRASRDRNVSESNFQVLAPEQVLRAQAALT